MQNFKTGDQVISLTNSSLKGSQKREKGKIYEVLSTTYCIGCGEQRVNIGQKTVLNSVACGGCKSSQENRSLSWTRSRYFIKVDPQSIEKAIADCLEEEDYESAAFLRDFVKEKQI